MSQRGGEVQSHLRIADHPIYTRSRPQGARRTSSSRSSRSRACATSSTSRPDGARRDERRPVVNIADYPDVEEVLDAIAALPNHVAGPGRAARPPGGQRARRRTWCSSARPALPRPRRRGARGGIRRALRPKGEKVQKTNVAAFRAGKAAGAPTGSGWRRARRAPRRAKRPWRWRRAEEAKGRAEDRPGGGLRVPLDLAGRENREGGRRDAPVGVGLRVRVSSSAGWPHGPREACSDEEPGSS